MPRKEIVALIHDSKTVAMISVIRSLPDVDKCIMVLAMSTGKRWWDDVNIIPMFDKEPRDTKLGDHVLVKNKKYVLTLEGWELLE